MGPIRSVLFIKLFFVLIVLSVSNKDLFSETGCGSDYTGRNPDWAFTIYPVSTLCCAFASILMKDFFTYTYLSGEVEYKFNKYFSFPVELRYIRFHYNNFFTDDEKTFNLFSAGPGLRFYPEGKGIKGVFIGHYIQFIYGCNKGMKDNKEFNDSGYIGLQDHYISTTWVGYRWMFKRVHLEASYGFMGSYPIEGRDEKKRLHMYMMIGLGFGLSF